MNVQMDDRSGFFDMGTIQLLSVPYALYAENAKKITDGTWLKNGDTLYYNDGNVGVGTSFPLGKLEEKAD